MFHFPKIKCTPLRVPKLPSSLAWIPANFTWDKCKPVVRSALAAWVSSVIFIVPRTEGILGQASFLIIIAAFLSPPSDPFVAVLERELVTLFFVVSAWAWSCLGLFLANLARSQHVPANVASLDDVVSGEYVEAAPSAVAAVFIFTGSALLLFIKARQGPGPFLVGTVFGCICLDISLTTGALFPYPYYTIGTAIVLPLAFHSAIALLLSAVIFPTSVLRLTEIRLRGVLTSLAGAVELQRETLATAKDFCFPSTAGSDIGRDLAQGSPLSSSSPNPNSTIKSTRLAPSVPDKRSTHASAVKFGAATQATSVFPPSSLTSLSASIAAAEAALAPLAAAARLLRAEVFVRWQDMIKLGRKVGLPHTNGSHHAEDRPRRSHTESNSKFTSFVAGGCARPNAADLIAIQARVRKMVVRVNGMGLYFTLIGGAGPVDGIGTSNREMNPGLKTGFKANSQFEDLETPASGPSRVLSRTHSPILAPTPQPTPAFTPVSSPVGTPRSSRHPSPSSSFELEEFESSSRGGIYTGSEDVEAGQKQGGTNVKVGVKVNADRPHARGRTKKRSRSKQNDNVDRHQSQHHQNRYHHRHHHDLLHTTLLHSLAHLHLPHSLAHPHLPHLSSSFSHLHLPHITQRRESAVGVFESQRYLNLEAAHPYLAGGSSRVSRVDGSHQLQHHHLRHGVANARSTHVQCAARQSALLADSCNELLQCCRDSLSAVNGWLAGESEKDIVKTDDRQTACESESGIEDTHRNVSVYLEYEDVSRKMKQRDDYQVRMPEQRGAKYEQLRGVLADALNEFRSKKRHMVHAPYRSIFDPSFDSDSGVGADIAHGNEYEEALPHRFLFNCYVYQYHLTQYAMLVVEMLNDVVRIENDPSRVGGGLWLPAIPFPKSFSWSVWHAKENIEREDDENPEVIPGMEPEWMSDLGHAAGRDPDALPPRNALEVVMNWIYRGVVVFSGGNVLFALKAGLLTVILCLPSLIKSSAAFAYRNKFVWAVFMGQLTIARFRGDTTFGLVARIISTFFGGLIGMTMWYISTGSGMGNSYGLAAVFAVCFPFFFYVRLYWTAPAMTNTILFVSVALVVGYSYQDTHLSLPSSPGWGFDVFWRRFVLVTAGVSAAFIFSFFPPSTTIRAYQRHTLATTTAEIGSIYCSVVSFANSNRRNGDSHKIVQSMVAIRSKLTRSIVMRANVIYEFSLRGKWPVERYHRIVEIELQIAYLLSHLWSIVDHLEPSWAHAFLRRTRFLDADFQGDVLAVITLISTALRTGMPLPQITPCPLLDRFMVWNEGLNVLHQESEDDYGLPRTLTTETLENEQYLIFCVGVATAFAIMTRLDRLMVATKELVGEQYHIYGVGAHGQYPDAKADGADMPFLTTSGQPTEEV